MNLLKPKYIFFILILSPLILGCKKETEQPEPEPEIVLQAKLQLMYNGNPVSLGERLFTQEGFPFELNLLSIFLTQGKNNDLTLFDAALMRLTNGSTLFSGIGNPTDFGTLTGSIGVVEPWNNSDPVQFPSNSPLHLNNSSDMHWGWTAGYIFYKVEGLFSSNPDAETLTEIFTYHMGNNQYRVEFDFANITWTKINEQLYETTVYFHIDDFLNGPGGDINMSETNFSHATPDKEELNQKIIENFKHALRLD